MSLTSKTPKDTYKDLLEIDNSNSGVDSTVRSIKTGDGSSTAISTSDRSCIISSTTDNTGAFYVQNSAEAIKFQVDTTNNQVKALAHQVNTQYANFSINSSVAGSAGMSANTHYAIPFCGTASATILSLGTSTDPATSLTLSTTADDVVTCFWYVMDNITIDRIVWWSGADAATGDTVRTHLMAYDVDIDNGSTSGDLSSGAVLATSTDVTNAGYEQAYYNQMSIATADVDAGKVILFAFRADSVNSDYAINATIKYHLR